MVCYLFKQTFITLPASISSPVAESKLVSSARSKRKNIVNWPIKVVFVYYMLCTWSAISICIECNLNGTVIFVLLIGYRIIVASTTFKLSQVIPLAYVVSSYICCIS